VIALLLLSPSAFGGPYLESMRSRADLNPDQLISHGYLRLSSFPLALSGSLCACVDDRSGEELWPVFCPAALGFSGWFYPSHLER